jgi:hypothetical protein
MSTEDDTFNALRRAPINVVDEEMLQQFNMPGPINPNSSDTYEIELVDEADFSLLNVILQVYHWNLESYLTYSDIKWRFRKCKM